MSNEVPASPRAFPPRFALVSRTCPPSPNGQAVILGRLLRSLPSDSYCVISGDAGDQAAVCEPLQAEHLRLPDELYIGAPKTRGLRRYLEIADMPLRLSRRARQIAGMARDQRCDAIVGCSGELFDVPAACMAARSLGIRFYAYFFDYYAKQFDAVKGWMGVAARAFAGRMERFVLRHASGVFVPNEFLRDEYSRQHGVQPVIVRNAYDSLGASWEGTCWPADPGTIRMVYSGSIYEAHYDAFRNLVRAVNDAEADSLRLSIYTSSNLAELTRAGITGPIELLPVVPHAAVRQIQSRADILFLPLAFDSPYPAVIRTSAPAKMGEYLASGRPILVHAPAESFVSWFFREHRCGWVVDRNDPAALAEAIQTIVNSRTEREERTARARQCAERFFSTNVVRAAFLEGLEARGIQASETRVLRARSAA